MCALHVYVHMGSLVLVMPKINTRLWCAVLYKTPDREVKKSPVVHSIGCKSCIEFELILLSVVPLSLVLFGCIRVFHCVCTQCRQNRFLVWSSVSRCWEPSRKHKNEEPGATTWGVTLEKSKKCGPWLSPESMLSAFIKDNINAYINAYKCFNTKAYTWIKCPLFKWERC